MALTASVCLYSNGEIHYIDALFMGTGSATQSGLNTIDLNTLNTWQQMVLYIIPMLTNPITVNTFVVFLRLYWFEKRFQHIATEAKKTRRSMTKTISRTRTADRDITDEERGLNGRSIVVMHNTTRPNSVKSTGDLHDGLDPLEKAEPMNSEMKRRSGSSNGSGETSNGQSSTSGVESEHDHAQRPQIKFADQVKRSDGLADDELRVPVQRSTEEHIAFLERQRNREDNMVLRIPGPRDADAGVAPQAVDESDPATRTISRRESAFSRDTSEHRSGDDHSERPLPRRNITITEPTRPSTVQHVAEDAVAAKHTLGALRLRRPNFFNRKTKDGDDSNDLHKTPSRIPTLKSIKSALSTQKDEGMPYLSWEATVGRNSAFVDLTEEQREELGGIEYRSLKSLALILVLYFWGFSIFAVVCLLPWIVNSPTYGAVVTSAGQGRPWWSIYTSSSAFNDVGFTLTPDSMISFQAAVWPLVLMSFLIVIGNTGFPIMLRIIIWVTSKWVPKESGIWEELKFLLDHPRRCFTLLFPSKATWWLFWILVILNGLDLVLFIILDVSLHYSSSECSPAHRLLVAEFNCHRPPH
jgi:potassium uptake Trk family protein